MVRGKAWKRSNRGLRPSTATRFQTPLQVGGVPRPNEVRREAGWFRVANLKIARVEPPRESSLRSDSLPLLNSGGEFLVSGLCNCAHRVTNRCRRMFCSPSKPFRRNHRSINPESRNQHPQNRGARQSCAPAVRNRHIHDRSERGDLRRFPGLDCFVVAMNDGGRHYAYPAAVRLRSPKPSCLHTFARRIS